MEDFSTLYQTLDQGLTEIVSNENILLNSGNRFDVIRTILYSRYTKKQTDNIKWYNKIIEKIPTKLNYKSEKDYRALYNKVTGRDFDHYISISQMTDVDEAKLYVTKNSNKRWYKVFFDKIDLRFVKNQVKIGVLDLDILLA